MDQFDNKLSIFYGYSVLNRFKSSNDSDIHYPKNIKYWGIRPSFIGHSFGELPAAYCSGMISLDTLCIQFIIDLKLHVAILQHQFTTPNSTILFKQIIPPNSKVSVYSALHKKGDDIQEIQKTISQLFYNNGYNINFKSQFKNDFKFNKMIYHQMNYIQHTCNQLIHQFKIHHHHHHSLNNVMNLIELMEPIYLKAISIMTNLFQINRIPT
ncbi:hypothetical protein ACTA71_002157 [Dictyostelium dimigraforme]